MSDISIIYIVQYSDTNRTEGGTTATRHFESQNKALSFIAQQVLNPTCFGFKLIKQTSVITRERIELA